MRATTSCSLSFILSIVCVFCRAQKTATAEYQNPLIPAPNNNPDPGAHLYFNGKYYVATTGNLGEGFFPIHASADLVNWMLVGSIFPSGSSGVPSWAVTDFWAPELHFINNLFVAVFAARNKDGILCVGLATSAGGPLGPWTDRGEPLVVSSTEGNIDPTVSTDQKTGDLYLVWKVDGNANGLPTPILARKLIQVDKSHFTLQGETTELIRETLPWEGALVEAPWIIYNSTQEEYFLFYSANAYYNASYAVGVARASSLLGPYQKKPFPILHSNQAWSGPGHCSVIKSFGSPESLLMFYHSYSSNAVGGNFPRLLMMDVVQWTADGWPSIETNSPSTTPQPIPEISGYYISL